MFPDYLTLFYNFLNHCIQQKAAHTVWMHAAFANINVSVTKTFNYA